MLASVSKVLGAVRSGGALPRAAQTRAFSVAHFQGGSKDEFHSVEQILEEHLPQEELEKVASFQIWQTMTIFFIHIFVR